MDCSVLKASSWVSVVQDAVSIFVMPTKADNVLKNHSVHKNQGPVSSCISQGILVKWSLASRCDPVQWLIDWSTQQAYLRDTGSKILILILHAWHVGCNVARLSPSRTEVDEKRQSAFHSTKYATRTPDMYAQIVPRSTVGLHSAQCWHTKWTLFSEKVHRHSHTHSWW